MTQITEKTAVPLKLVFAIFGAFLPLIAMAFWIGVEVHSIRVLMQSAWTVHDQDRWSIESQFLNPTIKFPDAYGIVQKRKAANLAN